MVGIEDGLVGADDVGTDVGIEVVGITVGAKDEFTFPVLDARRRRMRNRSGRANIATFG